MLTKTRSPWLLYLRIASKCTLQNLVGLSLTTLETKRCIKNCLKNVFTDSTDCHSFFEQRLNYALIELCCVLVLHFGRTKNWIKVIPGMSPKFSTKHLLFEGLAELLAWVETKRFEVDSRTNYLDDHLKTACWQTLEQISSFFNKNSIDIKNSMSCEEEF